MTDNDHTSRPPAKRVRSEQDHSKAETKAREDDIEHKKKKKTGGESEDQQDKNSDHTDDDWLSLEPFRLGASREGWTTRWRQSCWCGKTAFVYDSDPVTSKYCHCEDCQRLHGAPFQHAAIFHKNNVRLDSSPEYLGFLSAHGEVHPLSNTPTPLPRKTSCRACGSPLFDEGRNMILAFPPTFEFARSPVEMKTENHGKGDQGAKQIGLPPAFMPKCHIFYERRLVDIHDGLVKWRGLNDKSETMTEEQRP